MQLKDAVNIGTPEQLRQLRGQSPFYLLTLFQLAIPTVDTSVININDIKVVGYFLTEEAAKKAQKSLGYDKKKFSLVSGTKEIFAFHCSHLPNIFFLFMKDATVYPYKK
jgi:hypothetical protein